QRARRFPQRGGLPGRLAAIESAIGRTFNPLGAAGRRPGYIGGMDRKPRGQPATGPGALLSGTPMGPGPVSANNWVIDYDEPKEWPWASPRQSPSHWTHPIWRRPRSGLIWSRRTSA